MPDQRVFLDVGIGDAQLDSRNQEDWRVSCEFLKATHQQATPLSIFAHSILRATTDSHVQLSLPATLSPEQLDNEQLELAEEAFMADPAWAKQVPCVTQQSH